MLMMHSALFLVLRLREEGSDRELYSLDRRVGRLHGLERNPSGRRFLLLRRHLD